MNYFFFNVLLAVSSCIICIGRTTYSDLEVNFLDTKTTWKSLILKTLKF